MGGGSGNDSGVLKHDPECKVLVITTYRAEVIGGTRFVQDHITRAWSDLGENPRFDLIALPGLPFALMDSEARACILEWARLLLDLHKQTHVLLLINEGEYTDNGEEECDPGQFGAELCADRPGLTFFHEFITVQIDHDATRVLAVTCSDYRTHSPHSMEAQIKRELSDGTLKIGLDDVHHTKIRVDCIVVPGGAARTMKGGQLDSHFWGQIQVIRETNHMRDDGKGYKAVLHLMHQDCGAFGGTGAFYSDIRREERFQSRLLGCLLEGGALNDIVPKDDTVFDGIVTLGRVPETDDMQVVSGITQIDPSPPGLAAA